MATHPSSGARKGCSSPPSSPPFPMSPGGGVDRLTALGPRLLHCESPCSKGVPELVIVQDITDLAVGEEEQEGALVEEGGGEGCPPGDAPCPPAREAAGGVTGPALPHRPALLLESSGVSSTTGQHPRPDGGADMQPDTTGEHRGEGERECGEDNVTASLPRGCPAPPPLGKAMVLCEVPGGDMQGPEWSDLVCWQCGKECQVPQWAGTSDCDGQAGSLCHGVVGEAHAAHCPGEVVGSLQVLVGEALWQYPVLGHAEQDHHHAGEEWALVLSGLGWRAAINSCGGGGELVTMSSDNMAGGAAPSPAALRPEPPSFSGRCSSIYGFKISGADSSKVRNLLPMFVSGRNTSREIPGGVTFRVKGDASWQTQRPKRNSDKCDIRMYRGEEGGAEDKDESGFIKLCGVNLGSGPAASDPYPLFRCNTLPRRLPSYRLSPLPAWPQASQTSLDSEIASSVPSSRRQSLIEAEEGLATAHVQPGGDVGGGRGSGASLPRPPPSCESSSSAASPPWGPSTPPPPWGSTGSAPPDTTRCYVNSIPRPYRGSASSSTSTSPVPPAVPQLHRPRDFLPNTAEHSEPSQEDVILPLHQDDLDPCFPYELQPPAPLLTTRRSAAQRGAVGHAGITVSPGEITSSQDAEVRVQLTSANTPTIATDPTVSSGASLASGTSAEGVAVAPSQVVSWPPRGANAQGCTRRESGTHVVNPSTPYQCHRHEPEKSMEVDMEAMTQALGTAFYSTAVTEDCQPVPREATLLDGAKQLSCNALGVTRPSPTREATPESPSTTCEKKEEVTPPASKEATPEPCLFSPIKEEEEEEEEEGATPPIEEGETTPPSSKETTPQPSLYISEVTPPTSREATPQPSHPCVSEEEGKSLTYVDIIPHPSSPSPAQEEVTSLVSSCSFAPEETSPHPSPPPHLPYSEVATPCHSDEDTLPSSILSHPEEIIPPPPQFKEATPPPCSSSPPSTPPVEEKTFPSSPSSSLIEEATSSSLSEVTLPLCSFTLSEEAVPPSCSNEPMLSASSPSVASMQASPLASPPVTPRDVTPPSSLYYSISEEVTPSPLPSVPSQEIASFIGKEATTCMTSTEIKSPPITIRDVTPPSIKTKEATPLPSPGGMSECVSPQKESVAVGSYEETGEGVVTNPWVRSSEAVSKTGISQRAAMLSRQADSPPLPRPTRFPLDIICGSKVSGELSPVTGTRHRLSSLGQVLPPPAHTSTRSKSASRVGSGGTDSNLSAPCRESDTVPKGGSGQELGQAETRTAPLPIVLPLDTSLKNKIRQTINSFAGQEATPSHDLVEHDAFTSVLSTTQDDMEAQCNKESGTDQHISYSPMPGNEALVDVVSDSCGDGSVSDVQAGGGTHSHSLSKEVKAFIDDAVGTGQVEDPDLAVADVNSAFCRTLCKMTIPEDLNTTEDDCHSQIDDTSPVMSVDGESCKVISSSLPEETPAVVSGQVSSYGSRSPTQLQELETEILFIDEGPTLQQEALKTHDSHVTATEYKDMKSLTSSLQEERKAQPAETATCQFPIEVSSDEAQEQENEEIFAAVRVVVTEARESSPECEAEASCLAREESVEEYEPALEIVSLNPSRTSSHSSISVATVVTLGSHSHTPELPLPDEDAEEEFVDAIDGTEVSRETPPNSKSNETEASPVEAQSVSFVGASLKVECEALEDGSVSSGGQATDADLPASASASASASSAGSDTWWTSAGGPVARRDLFPLDEDEDEAQWRAAHTSVHPETDEEPPGYGSDEDFATMDAGMQRLEEKLKKFERELGGNDGSVIDECGSGKRDSITSPPRSYQGNESLQFIIPEVFPSRRSTQTKHLSLMTQLEVHQYGDSASESESESRVSSSSDSADFLFVKTKVKVKPGERISRSLEQRRPKNLHILGKSTGDNKNKEKEGACLFEERVDLSSLIIPLESAGEEPSSKPRSESISSFKFDDDVSDGQRVEEMMPDKDMCESITTETDDVLWGDEDHLLLGYIWHEDDMAAVDFEGLEDFQSFEGQEALMFMFEDDDEDEILSDEESEGDVLPESRDEADISPGEYMADESEGEGDSRRSRTLPAAKGSDNTFVAAFKNGLRKASKYFGPKSDARVKKVSGGGRDSSQDALSPTPPASAGMEDNTTAGVYNVQSGLVGGPTSHHAPFSDSESADIYSCSSGEYYAAPAMCVNTSDEDPSLALNKATTPQKEAPSQPPVPPRRWSNRKSRMVQDGDVSPRGHAGAVQQPIAAPPITSLPASSAPHAGIPRSEHRTNGSKEMSPSPAVVPQHMNRTVGSPVWEGYCPPAAPFPGTHMLPHQPCVPGMPWAVDPYVLVPEAAHHQHQHTVPNHRLAHTSPTHPVHPYVAPDAVLPYPCEAHHAAYSHPCAGHLAASHASPMAPHIASHSHKPTSVKQLKRKQQERILRQEAEEGLEAAGCAFCVGMPQARQQPPQHAVHWRQSSPHPHASNDRRSWPPRK